MRDVETHRTAKVHQVAEADEVVHEAVIPEEGAAFGEHQRARTGLHGLVGGMLHFTGRKELSLFDVYRAPSSSAGGQQIGLSAQEGWYLQQVDLCSDLLGLIRLVHIGGGWDAEELSVGLQEIKPFLHAGPTGARKTRAIGFVEGPFEDPREACLATGFGNTLADGSVDRFRLQDAGPCNDDQREIGPYFDGACCAVHDHSLSGSSG